MKINDNIFVAFKPVMTKNTNKLPLSSKNPEKHEDKSNLIWLSLAAVGICALGAGVGIAKYRKNAAKKVTSYASELAKSLGENINKTISPKALSSVVDAQEFLNIVKKLKPENFVASKENIDKGIFLADLHSHSNFSDGKASVESILDNVCAYADELFTKTKQKFLFALTDHDTAEGAKKALQLISQNPKKFENVKFVVGSEISYLMKSPKTTNPCETQEILVYGFNPFAHNVEEFFAKMSARRDTMIKNYINDLSKTFADTKFSEDEFFNVFTNIKTQNKKLIMNSFWELYHYGQVKKVLSDTAKYKKLNPEEYFKEIISQTTGKINLHKLKEKGLVENWINENPLIKTINDKYKPYIDKNGNIIQVAENLLSEINAAFANEKNCSMAFAHPYYLAERTDDVLAAINNVKQILGNKLKFTESYHQAYSSDITKIEINEINKLCENGGILPIGGRDNHKNVWLEF